MLKMYFFSLPQTSYPLWFRYSDRQDPQAKFHSGMFSKNCRERFFLPNHRKEVIFRGKEWDKQKAKQKANKQKQNLETEIKSRYNSKEVRIDLSVYVINPSVWFWRANIALEDIVFMMLGFWSFIYLIEVVNKNKN